MSTFSLSIKAPPNNRLQPTAACSMVPPRLKRHVRRRLSQPPPQLRYPQCHHRNVEVPHAAVVNFGQPLTVSQCGYRCVTVLRANAERAVCLVRRRGFRRNRSAFKGNSTNTSASRIPEGDSPLAFAQNAVRPSSIPSTINRTVWPFQLARSPIRRFRIPLSLFTRVGSTPGCISRQMSSMRCSGELGSQGVPSA